MKDIIVEKVKESVKAVLPITFIVLVISLFFNGTRLISVLPFFLISSFLLIVGMSLFELGADISMVSIGDKIGSHLTNKKSIPLILLVSFIIGFIVTVAEPDLNVLASQVPSVSSSVLILTVGIGVGVFLLLASLRMLFQWKFSYFLIGMCLLSFVLGFFVDSEFVPLAFDAGGVTTGPLSVPLMMALCAGLSSMRSDGKKKEDTFGMLSFCSLGPVIIVLILGLIYKGNPSYSEIFIPTSNNFLDVLEAFGSEFPIYLKEVLFSIGPIIILFIIYDLIYLKISKRDLLKIGKGLIYTYLGLSIFLTGVNIGFMPMGYLVGWTLSRYTYLLIPLSLLLGYFIVSSEPAVAILTLQIENITNGNIKRKVMNIALGIGVSIATCLSIIRVLTGISIWWFLLPGYAFALIMSFFVPPVFTAIAFDSGGVASGTMTATFLLPFAIGIAEALGKNVLLDAFGLIATVATIPLITVQLIGLIYKFKTKTTYTDPVYNEEVIDY